MTATDASPALRRLASSAGQRQRQLASDGTNSIADDTTHAARGCVCHTHTCGPIQPFGDLLVRQQRLTRPPQVVEEEGESAAEAGSRGPHAVGRQKVVQLQGPRSEGRRTR